MDHNSSDLRSLCTEINFGEIQLEGAEKAFYRRFNNEIISLCRSLPESVQTDGLLFMMRYDRVSFGEELNFFKHYYAPSWSVIYWLAQSKYCKNNLSLDDIKSAITGQSMAMLLHSLDDHINDGDMPATHLTLLLRSQAWLLMKAAFNNLADCISGGQEIVRKFIDDYYSSLCSAENIHSLDMYCRRFKRQMSTWLVVPVILSTKVNNNGNFPDAVQKLYTSFGIAWRLLDDIKDINRDMTSGTLSSVYWCLPEKDRNRWEDHINADSDANIDCSNTVYKILFEDGIIDSIADRISKELQSAASIAQEHHLQGLAKEFNFMKRGICKIYDGISGRSHFR